MTLLLRPTYFTKGVGQYNPLPEGCLLYVPFWHPSLNGDTFRSTDRNRYLLTNSGSTHKPYQGRDLDGVNDGMSLGSQSALLPLVAGTIMFWTKWGQSAPQYIWSNNADELSIFDNGGELRLYWDAIQAQNWAYTTNLVVGTWYHMAFTFGNGLTGRLYVDAVEKASAACSATNPTSGTTRIGILSDGVTSPYKGIIREIGEWDSQLPATAITYHREQTLGRHL